jgi:hypothetical protein
MIKYFFAIIFILTGLVYFTSCKKDKDTNSPSVIFESPQENQSFNVYDNMPVRVKISDDYNLISATITLVNSEFNPVHNSYNINVSGFTYLYNEHYSLDNIHLESGFYYIRIIASDGANETRKYLKIYINAIPRAVKRVYVASANNNIFTNISIIDSNFTTVAPYKNFQGDFLDCSNSSYFQQFYSCGNFTGSFNCVNLTNNLIRFSLPATVSSSPFFTGYYSEDKINVVSYYNENILSFDYMGSAVSSAQALQGYYAQKMIRNSNYLIAEEKNKITSTKKLVAYFPSGALQQEVPLNQNIVALIEKNYHEVFAFGNNFSGQGIIQLYDRTNNNLWNPYNYNLAIGSILSAVKIDDNTYLIGHSNGTIYKYQYQTNSVTPYLSGFTAIQLCYDFERNFLYVVEQNAVVLINYPFASAINSLSFGETVLGISLLYNR